MIKNLKEKVTILAPVSLGELIDKITILEIKKEKIDSSKLNNVLKELNYLNIVLKDINVNVDQSLIKKLKKINRVLWDIEDEIRNKEFLKNFDESFIKLARLVYLENDKRSSIKHEINSKYNSSIVEEKSYKKY